MGALQRHSRRWAGTSHLPHRPSIPPISATPPCATDTTPLRGTPSAVEGRKRPVVDSQARPHHGADPTPVHPLGHVEVALSEPGADTFTEPPRRHPHAATARTRCHRAAIGAVRVHSAVGLRAARAPRVQDGAVEGSPLAATPGTRQAAQVRHAYLGALALFVTAGGLARRLVRWLLAVPASHRLPGRPRMSMRPASASASPAGPGASLPTLPSSRTGASRA